MSATAPDRGREARSPRQLWVWVHLLLVPVVVVPLLVPLYARETPTFLDFPFFFWFQLAIVPVAAAFTTAAFLLAKKAGRLEREARGLRSQSHENREAREDREGGAR